MFPFEEGSVNFITLLIILINVFTAMLICFLWIGKSKENNGNIFLSLILLQLALYVFPEFLFILGLLDNFPHAVRIYVLGSFLLGPITYFYIRTCIEHTFRVTRKMWWHFIPAVLDFFFQLPFYTLRGEEKLQYFYNFFSEDSLQQPLWLTVIKILHMIIYLLISMRIINKYMNHLPNSVSSIDNVFHRWLFLFCFALTTPFIAGLLFSFLGANFSYLYLVLSLFIVIFIALTLLVIKPSIFHKFPNQILLINSIEEKKEKYESSNLQNAQKEKYLNTLINYFETEKPFLEPELTLAHLSDQMNIPSHYLSQVINEKMKCNFLDFVNGYRIKDAQSKLKDSSFSHYTILAVAFESGFNSKTAFYSSFKKYTGTTPSSYRKSFQKKSDTPSAS